MITLTLPSSISWLSSTLLVPRRVPPIRRPWTSESTHVRNEEMLYLFSVPQSHWNDTDKIQ